MTSPLELRDLSAGYERLPVVTSLDLTVGHGEMVALLGPNGAGKTTTLTTAAGLLPALGGSVLVAGRSLNGRNPHEGARRGVALVADDGALFTQLTVHENLRLGLRRSWFARPHRLRAPGHDLGTTRFDLDEVLDTFPQLRGLLPRRAGLLSGGERRVLAIARALLTEPRVLLVDELSLGLAPIVVRALLPLLRNLSLEHGLAIVLVEQHVRLALAACDRGCVLANGTLVIDAPADELLRDLGRVETSYFGAAP